jgi:27-O-demethylrifamycin SV methyltransferase
MDNQTHYDRVTDAWTFILGDNLHYGLFARADESLAAATDALIDRMADLVSIGPNTSLLDVGCGIGGPAFRLAERTGCTISAISISSRGIALAEQTCRRLGWSDRIRFYHRDALANGFPDGSFDVVWVMESSHLMRDKVLLCAENYRVLRPGGAMLLCDLVLKRELSIAEVYRLRQELSVLERAFGKAKMETLDFYEAVMRRQGFRALQRIDISREVYPTLDKWKENLERHRVSLAALLPAQDLDNFARSCDVLKKFFAGDILGYGIVTGVKAN